MIAKLLPLDGSAPISITADVTVVGRKRGLCDLVLSDSSISKVHAVLAKTDGLLFLRDLGSTNGVKVNGQRVVRGALIPGDELAFANVRFRVHLGPGKPEVGHHEQTEMLSGGNGELAQPEREALDALSAAPPNSGIDMSSDSDVRLLTEDSSIGSVC
jgi:pSer/pThr/pTyr-binding forkhead associated (FHA) protein